MLKKKSAAAARYARGTFEFNNHELRIDYETDRGAISFIATTPWRLSVVRHNLDPALVGELLVEGLGIIVLGMGGSAHV